MGERTIARLLGRPEVRVGASSYEPPPSKSSAFLLYLASSGTWVPRDDVVYLLWPDKDEDRARSNLRQLLYSLTDIDFVNDVDRDGNRIRWQVDTDLASFRNAVARGDHRGAAQVYSGRFLDGFRLDRVPEFESWLDMEREQLHAEWRQACLVHATELRTSHQPDLAAQILERVLDEDPLDEPIVRDLMATLAEAGRRSEALAAYDAFGFRLERDIGMEPAPETSRLAESLRERASSYVLPSPHEDEAVEPAQDRPRAALPGETTAFVGRAEELDELAHLVTENQARLVNLVAPGGMGKTRLALALARRLESQFLDGAAFAPLASVEDPAQMAGALADALGLRRSPHTSIQDQLILHLSDLDILLVLDQLEHLTEDLSLLEFLLERCPGVTLVTTSRERLGLRGGWDVDVHGLEAEPPDPASPAPRKPDGAHVSPSSDAAELFIRTAQRTTGDLHAKELVPEDVRDLCWMVRGMPLAIILAAGWLRVMPLEEIRAELRRGLDILAVPHDHAHEERHASIRSVLDSTWSRLRPGERAAWMQLSITDGGFDREAAEAIAGIGPPGLLALMNKAVLMRTDRRFDMHPLIREYGRDRARREGVLEGARSRLAEHYLALIAERSSGFEGPDQIQVVRDITPEMANIRAAWRAAADLGWAERLIGATHGLATYHEIMGLQRELSALAEYAVEAFGGLDAMASKPVEHQRLIGRLLPFAHELSGRYAERARHSLEIARRLDDLRGVAEAHLHLVKASDTPDRENAEAARAAFARLGLEHGIARTDVAIGFPLVLHGFYQEGIDTALRAAERFERLGDERLMALALDDMTPGHVMLGEFDHAEELILRQEEINRRIGVWTVDVQYLGSRQWLEMERGDYEAAQHYQDLYHETYERAGQDMSVNRLFLGSGLHYLAGRYDEAWSTASEYMAIARERGSRHLSRLLVLMVLARIAIRRDDPDLAYPYVLEAVELAFEIGTPRFLNDATVGAAAWLYASGRSELAAQLVASAEADPATEISVRREIDWLRSIGLDPSAGGPPRDRDWVRATLAEVFGLPLPDGSHGPD